MAERFIREYANHKIRIYRELEKNFPEKKGLHRGKESRINRIVEYRDKGIISVDEALCAIMSV